MTDDEVGKRYAAVVSAGIDKPGTNAFYLKQNHLELRQAARDALDCLKNQDWTIEDSDSLLDFLESLLDK